MRVVKEHAAQRIRRYAEAVSRSFGATFLEAGQRFPDWQRLITRFDNVIAQVLEDQTPFRAADEAHNELCIAGALLASETPSFDRIEYEKPLPGSSRSIDFVAHADGGVTVYVDVKTIKPNMKDRWGQYERALSELWFPENVCVGLDRALLGGELWHSMFASRSRMLEHALELEDKIAASGLADRESTYFILALCGEGFHWKQSQLEDFVNFYRTGNHRADDPFSDMEDKHIAEKNLSVTGTISRFACLFRSQGDVRSGRPNWNVQPPRSPVV